MIYWQKCQSEIASALKIPISDIDIDKLFISAYNADWDAYEGVILGTALQYDNINLNINIRLSDYTGGDIRINFIIIHHNPVYI